MELDELKTKWKQYDDKLKTHILLNEHALRRLMDAQHHDAAGYSRAKEYYGIGFSGLALVVFGILAVHVHNNPPMLFAVAAVLVITLISIGMSIYKVGLSASAGSDVIDNAVVVGMGQVQPAMRMAHLFSMIFSPVLIAFLFLLLFFGMSVKTF